MSQVHPWVRHSKCTAVEAVGWARWAGQQAV